MRTTCCFNDNWAFLKDVNEILTSISEDAEIVNLPHTWNGTDGQDGGNDYFRGSCCYVKNFTKSVLPTADEYYLEIHGANSSANVYLNDKFLASHDGGYSTWRVNLTEELRDENTLAIMVDNSPTEAVYPQTADFTFYGGLYRNVDVLAVNKTHFDLDYYGGKGVQITPIVREKDANITLKVYVTNLEAQDQLVYVIKDGDGNVVDTITSKETEVLVQIADVHLWDGVKDPYLYTAEVSIVRNEQVIDRVSKLLQPKRSETRSITCSFLTIETSAV